MAGTNSDDTITPGDILIKPFKEFTKLESAGGIVLILASLTALVLANSPLADAYHHFWEKSFSIGFGDWSLSKHLLHWINDGLMVVFFFVVGLEIKREILVGELSSLKKSMLPIFAAMGGMLLPALIYMSINMGGEGADGWGIPMATDIAFALGVLALLGKQVPISLKVFLTALAIIDDIGAVLVIAIFYTNEVHMSYLVGGAIILAIVFAGNKMDIRHPVFYSIMGVLLWYAFLKSGLHATIAGVLLAFFIPARTRIHAKQFVDQGRSILNELEASGISKEKMVTTEDQISAIHSIKEISEDLETPLQRMEHTLHPLTTFLIVPVFALANAGVSMDFEASAVTHGVTMGVLLGLLVGKLVGVLGFSWLGVKLKIASLPEGVTWHHISGAGLLAGIGFTMSLFIANLAFGSGGDLLTMSKLGILGASFIAGVVGFIYLRMVIRRGSPG